MSTNIVLSGSTFSTPFGYDGTSTITNFVQISNSITGGNDILHYSADFITTFYSDPGLTTPTGTVDLQGEFDVTVYGRTGPFQLGTFNYTVTMATFSGFAGGQALTTELDPSQISSGTTSITAGPGVGQYTISSPATVHAGYQVNNGPFTATPTFTATTTAVVPEPSSLAMVGTSIVGGLIFLRRRRVA